MLCRGPSRGQQNHRAAAQKYYDDGECFKKHLTLLEKETYYGNDEGEYLEVDDEDNNIVYVIDEDGNISLDLNDPQATGRPQYLVAEVMSYYDDDETDIGVGRGVQRLTLQPDLTHIRPNTVPAGVEMREYLLTSKDGDGGERASRVSFGIDGDKAYLVSYDWYDIENIAVGHVAGDKIVFSCPQFAAFDELSLFTAEDPATDADLDEVVFDYDPESGVCSCAGEATMCLYSLVWGAYLSSVSNPMMYPVDADFLNASPQDPTVIDFRHYDGRFGSIYWDVPDTTVKNHSFAGERMYVNIYKNGEILTIKNYEGEEYTDIYYGFDAPRFEFRPPSLYMEFHSDDYTTFGLQSFYVGSDGVTYASHLVTYDPYTDQYVGIRSADIDRSLVRAGYYDMTGRPIANPVAGGLYILRCTYTDGSTTTAKVVY